MIAQLKPKLSFLKTAEMTIPVSNLLMDISLRILLAGRRGHDPALQGVILFESLGNKKLPKPYGFGSWYARRDSNP